MIRRGHGLRLRKKWRSRSVSLILGLTQMRSGGGPKRGGVEERSLSFESSSDR